MTQVPPQKPSQPPPAGKGSAFFKRAEEVKEMGNLDYSLEMFIEGLKREPENIERGHQGLRMVSLERKAKGGKAATLVEQLKRRGGKEPVDKLVNAEFLLAKEPGSVPHMLAVMKAAEELKLPELVRWVADIVLEAERQAKKPSRPVLVQIMGAYERIEDFPRAIQACDLALRTYPDDDMLQGKLRDLGATNTRVAGKYGEKGKFEKGVKDMAKQKELIDSDYFQQSRQALEAKIESARKEYLATPTVIGKIHGLVEALTKIEEESYENEAIEVLNKGFADTGAYQFKMRIGDVRMKQMTRRYRKLVEAGDKTAAAEQARAQVAFELQEFLDRAKNYPTDLSIKFELGRRQLLSGQLDEAIASFQQSQRDPRRHVRSLTYLGQAFAAKKWYREASETYDKALSTEMPEDRAKELRYSFGDVLEKMGDAANTASERLSAYEKARDQFSQVAQVDYKYRDTAARIDTIRKKIDESRGGGPAGGGSAPPGGGGPAPTAGG